MAERKKVLLKLPGLRWLCRRSEFNARHSNDITPEQQQADLGQNIRVPEKSKDDHGVTSKEGHQKSEQPIHHELGPHLIDRMEKLEEKIDILVVSHFHTSRSTGSTGSSIACQAMFDPEDKIDQRRNIQGAGVDACSQTDSSYPQMHHIMEDEDHAEQILQQKSLTAEIDRLIKFNNKLSSCVNALGSSGLIELIEMLGSSIERLHSELVSMRQQQQQQQQQNITNSEKSDNDNIFPYQRQQPELQAKATIQRLGMLLVRREEQLKQERMTTETCYETIGALEEKIQLLELEWRRVMPLISNSEVK